MVTRKLEAEIKGLVNKLDANLYVKHVEAFASPYLNQDFTKENVKRDIVIGISIENQKSGANIKNEQFIYVVKGIVDSLNNKDSFKEIFIRYDDKSGDIKEHRELKLNKDQFELSKEEMIKLIEQGK